jgi:TonB family protein
MTRTFRSIARRPSTASHSRHFAVEGMPLLLCLLSFPVVCWSTDLIIVKDIVVPNYPPLARMARLQGSVSVDIEISADGKVVSAKATGGDPILQRAAEKNIRLWTFDFTTGVKKFPLKHTVVYIYRMAHVYTKCPDVVFHLPDRVEISEEPAALEPNNSHKETCN